MVNLTDSFTKLYGRRPTETELGEMYRLKREQEGYKKIKAMEASQVAPNKRKTEPRTPKKPQRE